MHQNDLWGERRSRIRSSVNRVAGNELNFRQELRSPRPLAREDNYNFILTNMYVSDIKSYRI
jgi:hypothetical protein